MRIFHVDPERAIRHLEGRAPKPVYQWDVEPYEVQPPAVATASEGLLYDEERTACQLLLLRSDIAGDMARARVEAIYRALDPDA